MNFDIDPDGKPLMNPGVKSMLMSSIQNSDYRNFAVANPLVKNYLKVTNFQLNG